MATRIDLGDIAINVVKKDIKNLHLSVYPPLGRVQIAAPSRMSVDTIRVFAIAKLGWIKQQQKKFREQARETPREYLARESHYVWGKRYLLSIAEDDHAPTVTLTHSRMLLTMRAGADAAVREAMVARWYREQIKAVVPKLIEKWAPLLGVSVERVFVRQMKTKWGSCNPSTGTIRLNTELAKKAKDCLEYVVVHELIHLIEPTHNARFVALMDQFMPQWQFRRQRLNRLPVRHADWEY
jgi:predicted metal-dependent hydrolase